MNDTDSTSWMQGLQKNGLYYEGIVTSADDCLEIFKRDTVTSWGTRTSLGSASGSSGSGRNDKVIVSASY